MFTICPMQIIRKTIDTNVSFRSTTLIFLYEIFQRQTVHAVVAGVVTLDSSKHITNKVSVDHIGIGKSLFFIQIYTHALWGFILIVINRIQKSVLHPCGIRVDNYQFGRLHIDGVIVCANMLDCLMLLFKADQVWFQLPTKRVDMWCLFGNLLSGEN